VEPWKTHNRLGYSDQEFAWPNIKFAATSGSNVAANICSGRVFDRIVAGLKWQNSVHFQIRTNKAKIFMKLSERAVSCPVLFPDTWLTPRKSTSKFAGD